MPYKDPLQQLEYRKKWRAANTEKARSYGRNWYQAHKHELSPRASQTEKRKRYMQKYNAEYHEATYAVRGDAIRAAGRLRRKLDWKGIKNNELKTAYGITLDDYTKMLAAQNGVCAICFRPETATCRGRVRSLAVDHDHETDMVRGLLCGACNSALGLLGEDKDRIRSLVVYLEKYGG